MQTTYQHSEKVRT